MQPTRRSVCYTTWRSVIFEDAGRSFQRHATALSDWCRTRLTPSHAHCQHRRAVGRFAFIQPAVMFLSSAVRGSSQDRLCSHPRRTRRVVRRVTARWGGLSIQSTRGPLVSSSAVHSLDISSRQSGPMGSSVFTPSPMPSAATCPTLPVPGKAVWSELRRRCGYRCLVYLLAGCTRPPARTRKTFTSCQRDRALSASLSCQLALSNTADVAIIARIAVNMLRSSSS